MSERATSHLRLPMRSWSPAVRAVRIPLVISFFASEDRIHSLQSRKLQALLDAALFEPGNQLPLASAGLEPVDVPTSSPILLGTPHHLLLNELARSPETLVNGVLTLARQAADLDTGTLFSSTAGVILYVCRLGARVDNFISMLVAYDAGEHDSIAGRTFRGLELGPGVQPRLKVAQASLRGVLWGDLRRTLLCWYQKLVAECETAQSDDVLDENTRHMCNVHAHLLLLVRNAALNELSDALVSGVVCGVVFLSTRHEWNQDRLDATSKAHADKPWVGWRVPENELFEVLHVLRRKLVLWLRQRASQSTLDSVMDRVLRVSASTGSMLASGASDEQGRWAYVAGERNVGRFTRHSLRNGTASARHDVGGGATVGDGGEESIALMADDGQLSVEVDVQVMQLTLKAAHPQALPDEIAQLPDVKHVFGDVTMQACLLEQTAKRSCYRVVGRAHDIAFWPSADEALPQLDHFRSYYPEE